MKLLTAFTLLLTLAAAGCNAKKNSMSAAPDATHKYDQKTIATGGLQITETSSPTPPVTPDSHLST